MQQEVENEARAAEFAVVANTSAIRMEVYRDLRKNHLYVIKQDAARGIDFSSASGIDLLVMAPSPNNRAFQQLLGRVSRYKQPCFQAIVPNISVIDWVSDGKLSGDPIKKTDALRALAQPQIEQQQELLQLDKN